ncbi:hypothetical protein J14TS5_56700 [Paenibacillus lautus]|nr:hypothetical protein J14TS5_56700 [Paenibacillus lautus]
MKELVDAGNEGNPVRLSGFAFLANPYRNVMGGLSMDYCSKENGEIVEYGQGSPRCFACIA